MLLLHHLHHLLARFCTLLRTPSRGFLSVIAVRVQALPQLRLSALTAKTRQLLYSLSY
jgi:hypothetical protein